MHNLQSRLAEDPCFLSDLASDIFPDTEDPEERLINLVNLAVRAKANADSLSLLPARYHVFARALEGAFACLDETAHEALEDNPSRLFLTRREECPHCQSHVVELATCTRCGVSYVVGRMHRDKVGDQQYLRHLTGQPDDSYGEQATFLLSGETVGWDEDEAVANMEDLDTIADSEIDPHVLCLRCGAISPVHGTTTDCGCEPSSPKVVLRRVDVKDTPELRRCVACGAQSRSGIVYRFLTGQDAPVSVLATSLYQTLPASTDEEMEKLPGQGRKLLAFSDSRQDAAFFAPYLERTYRQVLRRRLILKSLLEDPAGRQGRLRLQDLVGRLQVQAEEAGLFTQRQSYDERQRLMATWLMQELIAWDRRMSLEGLGLLRFRLLRPERWQPPQVFLDAPWSLSDEQTWQLLVLLLDTLRNQGVTTYLTGVDARDEAFAPRNRDLYMRGERADTKKGIFAWVPARGYNRRLDILTRLLERTTDLSEAERQATAEEALKGIWKHMTAPGSGMARTSARREPRTGWRAASHQPRILGGCTPC